MDCRSHYSKCTRIPTCECKWQTSTPAKLKSFLLHLLCTPHSVKRTVQYFPSSICAMGIFFLSETHGWSNLKFSSLCFKVENFFMLACFQPYTYVRHGQQCLSLWWLEGPWCVLWYWTMPCVAPLDGVWIYLYSLSGHRARMGALCEAFRNIPFCCDWAEIKLLRRQTQMWGTYELMQSTTIWIWWQANERKRK